MIPALLLTSHWHDEADQTLLTFWWHTAAGTVRQQLRQPSVCFIEQQSLARARQIAAALAWPVQFRALELTHFNGEPACACYLPEGLLRRWREVLSQQGIVCREADVAPTSRYLMERFIYGEVGLKGELGTATAAGYLTADHCQFQHLPAHSWQPQLRCLSLDIETSLLRLDAEPQLFSIGLYGDDIRQVLMLGTEQNSAAITYFPDEPSLLQALLDSIRRYDPDVLLGWHIVQFDLDFLRKKFLQYGIPMLLGRDAAPVHWRQSHDAAQVYLQLSGRLVLDGISLLRQAGYGFENYQLAQVAQQLLGDQNPPEREDQNPDREPLFRQNKAQLALDNLADCERVWRIFTKLKLLDFVIERARLTGLALDKQGGSIAAFENLYLPKLHRAGWVAPNMDEGFFMENSPGGYVLDSTPGLFEHVLVLDFKSLYPSIIRTFCIDPMGLVAGLQADSDAVTVPGFMGARFHRQRHILPALLQELGSQRDAAKRVGNQALNQAIKIIMAACYGVLGAQGCRFADNRLTASITLRGHEIIQQSCRWVEAQGYQVIYGDTDSIFVWLNQTLDDSAVAVIGEQLMTGLNGWWQTQCQQRFGVESYLEIEYETHYRRFFMPALRGGDEGSKKRYAGLIYTATGEPRMVFKGLEAVRSDWTLLARRFQTELYRRLFLQEPYAHWLRGEVQALLAGERDDELLYHKRLRQPLAAYTKNIPPHAQAAAKLEQWRRAQGLPPLFAQQGGRISYYFSAQGPEPVLADQPRLPPDYHHYLEKQLRPAAEAIFQFSGDDFDALAGLQLSLF